MARMPQAQWLGEHSPRTPMSHHDIVCVHTIVGYAPAHAAHFSVKADGTILQSRDTKYRSAANLNGNHRIIAVENEDHGPAFGAWTGSAVPRLTHAQVQANAAILAWAHREHGIVLQLCPDSRPGSRGLAYHRQGIDGNFGSYRFRGRISGGEVWTEDYGKVCPGDNRIAQLPDILAAALGHPTPPPEDDVNLDDIINPHADKKDQLSVGEALRIAAKTGLRAEADHAQLTRALSGLAHEVAAAVAAELPPLEGVDTQRLRTLVYNQAARAIDNRLGSLDAG